MHNLSKEDIDYLFQKGTEKQEFPFQESSWENMEAMLDSDEKNRKLKRFALLGALLLLISAGGFYMFKKNNTSKINETVSGPIASVNQNNADENIKSEENLVNPKQTNNTNIEGSKPVNNVAPLGKKSTSRTQKLTIKEGSRNLQSQIENISSINKKIPVQEGPTKNNSSSTILSDSQESSTLLETPNSEISRDIDKIQKEPITSDFLPLAELSHLIEKGSALPSSRSIITNLPKVNRFSYRFLVGTEWSDVDNTAKGKAGFRLGLEAAYQFHKKFQLSTGFNVSLKRYAAAGTQYNTTQSRIEWIDDVPPEMVRGKNTVIEIPIEFTYYFNDYRQNGFFAGAGLNSYLMASEWYDFDFSPQYQSQNQLFWTTQNNDQMNMKKHYAGIATLEFGYQHFVSDKLALQVGPYAQMPLTGIGFGDMNVFSAGLQMRIAFSK